MSVYSRLASRFVRQWTWVPGGRATSGQGGGPGNGQPPGNGGGNNGGSGNSGNGNGGGRGNGNSGNTPPAGAAMRYLAASFFGADYMSADFI